MENFVVSPELLVSLAGVVLSLAFSYIPGLRVKFAALESDVKRLIMLGLIVVIAAAIFGLKCAGILEIGVACDKIGLQQMVWYVILGIIANQSAYQITPLPEEVKNARDGYIV